MLKKIKKILIGGDWLSALRLSINSFILFPSAYFLFGGLIATDGDVEPVLQMAIELNKSGDLTTYWMVVSWTGFFVLLGLQFLYKMIRTQPQAVYFQVGDSESNLISHGVEINGQYYYIKGDYKDNTIDSNKANTLWELLGEDKNKSDKNG